MSISFDYIFGNLTGWEELTGLSGEVISGITLAVLIILILLDGVICCSGCCLICCLYYKSKKQHRKGFNLNQVERTSRTFPKNARLSRVSNSSIGADIEWVVGKMDTKSLVSENAKAHGTNSIGRKESELDMVYEEPLTNSRISPVDKEDFKSSTKSGYVVMSRLDQSQYDSNNYDDVTNARPGELYDDVMNALPNLNPDAGTYDDVNNVRGLGPDAAYEDVLNVRINPH